MMSRTVGTNAAISTLVAVALLTSPAFAASPIPTAFNPTVIQAMQTIRAQTTLALNAPTVVPNRPAGYLTATTAAHRGAYQVSLWDTRQPLHVDNPAITQDLVPGGDIARFGAVRLPSPMPAKGSPNYLRALEQHNPIWAGGPPVAAAGRISLGDGIQAFLYRVDGQIQLDWAEGDWTIQVAGRSMAMVQKAAVPVVRLLHTYYLPPYPGIYAVRLQDHGRAAITSIDWMRGRVLSYVTNDHASATNPVATGRMAISWRPYAPGARITTVDAITPPFAGTSVRFLTGAATVPAVTAGYRNARQNLTFTAATYRPVEGFTGQLHGHPFVLDIYQDYPVGLFVGVRYNHRTVYFGYGPSPVFGVLNFTGNWVVLGSPPSGQYMAINLITGRRSSDAVTLKGYRGLRAPQYVGGLAGLQVPSRVPYPYGNN